jgi:hypothetical protein
MRFVFCEEIEEAAAAQLTEAAAAITVGEVVSIWDRCLDMHLTSLMLLLRSLPSRSPTLLANL